MAHLYEVPGIPDVQPGAIEVYETGTAIEVEVARGILADAGVESTVRDLSLRAIPVNFGGLSGYRVLVPAEVAPYARELLWEAVEDGALFEGVVLEVAQPLERF